LTGGGFVVAWEDATLGRIEARVFNSSGVAVTGDLLISSQFAGGSKSLLDHRACRRRFPRDLDDQRHGCRERR
jgi:hypothetical protein